MVRGLDYYCRTAFEIVAPGLGAHPVAGVDHFRTPVQCGIDILNHLCKSVGGLGVPRLAVDAIQGGGKVPISPTHLVGQTDGRILLRNLDGETVSYPNAPSGGSSES